ncbi:MAG: hypothetical protein EG824_02695 [Deltaproteobacteria bacterium]|nr:hypothetical protein [Deltaproteobacteria bacterium]
MRDRSVNSYDLKNAQQILSSLVPVPGIPSRETTATDEQHGYVRLAKAAVPVAEAPSPVGHASLVREAPPASVETQSHKFTNWESCIAWCMSLTRAEAAFVVDSQGFIIASRGRVPGHGFEGTGAELICSVDQLERVDPDAGKLQWVDLDFDKRRVVGFITPPRDSEYFVIGLMAPDSAYHSLKQVINRQIVENLSNLD